MLPDPLARLVTAALSEMQADPQHWLAPSRRREVYAALAGVPDPALRSAPCWLAIMAAQRVLPLLALELFPLRVLQSGHAHGANCRTNRRTSAIGQTHD